MPVELDEPEPVAPGDVELEPDVAEPDPDVVVSVDERGLEVDGDVAVGGEAEGVRSPGRSLVRLVPVSVHAVASVAINASAENPASVRFMNVPPVGVRTCGPIPMPALPICNGGAVHAGLRPDLLPVKCWQVADMRS